MKRPAGLAALAVLGACAPRPVPPPVVDMVALPCANAMVMQGAVPLSFDPKEKDEKTTIAILDGRSCCIQDADGSRRLYQLFALPEMKAPYILSIRTSPWADTILAPRGLLLAGDGTVMRSTSHADFIFRGEQLSALVRSHPGEAYLVVTSDTEVLGREVARITESVQVTAAVMPYGGAFIWHSGLDTTHRMTLSPAGHIEVTVAPFPAGDGKK
ncbi:MAG: hypothetical protein H0U98_03975 [Alphaproteobacteria bacterium]|nr:hypothetical protein [Alphaproteobacteria bacterium]